MINKLIFAPIPLLLGGWMFTSSFSSSTIQQSVTPYSTQQQTVEVEMPEPAKSFLRFGGGAIAIFGTSSLVFWELASRKRHHTRPQLLLPAAQNFAPSPAYSPNTSQPMHEINNKERIAQSVPHNQEQFVRSQFSEGAKQPNNPEVLKQIPNFYQTDGLPSSLSNEKANSVRQFDPQSKPEDKYASVRSLVYENTVGIVGKEKGSGKTSKLGYLIAEHIKLGHLVWMVNPFAKGQHWKGIKVFGRGYNFLEATNAIREFTRIAFWRIAEAGDETKEYEPFEDYHLNLALDEMSNYSSEIDAIDSTVMPKFWEAVVQFLRQANMSVSFASQVRQQQQPTTTLPLTNWTGDSGYQSIGRK
jgi:hypothetical protein